MAQDMKIDTQDEREIVAAKAIADEELLVQLAELMAGSSRTLRQKAASTLAIVSNQDASALFAFVDDIASGLTRPEAQTRWEALHILDQMGKAGQRYGENVLAAAEDALYDEKNGIVRESARCRCA